MFDPISNVPVPAAIRPASASKRKYPFETLEVGQMFFIPEKTKNTMSTHASTVGKELGKKFLTRLCYMKEVKHGWVNAEPGEEGAVLGIGVWRMEDGEAAPAAAPKAKAPSKVAVQAAKAAVKEAKAKVAKAPKAKASKPSKMKKARKQIEDLVSPAE